MNTVPLNFAVKCGNEIVNGEIYQDFRLMAGIQLEQLIVELK